MKYRASDAASVIKTVAGIVMVISMIYQFYMAGEGGGSVDPLIVAAAALAVVTIGFGIAALADIRSSGVYVSAGAVLKRTASEWLIPAGMIVISTVIVSLRV